MQKTTIISSHALDGDAVVEFNPKILSRWRKTLLKTDTREDTSYLCRRKKEEICEIGFPRCQGKQDYYLTVQNVMTVLKKNNVITKDLPHSLQNCIF